MNGNFALGQLRLIVTQSGLPTAEKYLRVNCTTEVLEEMCSLLGIKFGISGRWEREALLSFLMAYARSYQEGSVQ